MELIKKEIKEEPRLVYTYKMNETYRSSMALIWKEISEIEGNNPTAKGYQ
ncbi:hypothetical protein [Gracilibacillus lacisalsi]|nr:hypothetical protein [Gracilibacillus lacisalsi]